MLLWSRRSRAAILIGFAVVVLVVFVAPLATVVIAGLAGSWTDALPTDLGFGHFDDALSGENLASLSVSLQTALISGGLALVLGTWAALAAREAPRWLSRVTDAVFHLPIAVPSVAIGLGLLIAFNSRRYCSAEPGGSSSWRTRSWCSRLRSAPCPPRSTVSTRRTGRRPNPSALVRPG